MSEARPRLYLLDVEGTVAPMSLVTEQLSSERLNKRTALAVLSSDVISSSAYATEQALIPLIKVIGIAAFGFRGAFVFDAERSRKGFIFPRRGR